MTTLDLPERITPQQITAACEALALGHMVDSSSGGYTLRTVTIDLDGVHLTATRGPAQIIATIPIIRREP